MRPDDAVERLESQAIDVDAAMTEDGLTEQVEATLGQ